MSLRRALVTAAFTGVIATAVLEVRADPRSDADALILRGIELREKRRDDEALALFKQALAASPSARARAQVGLAEQALGMWVAAEADVAAALATDDEWIAKNRAALEGALAIVRNHLGTLQVRGAEHAEVYLDGVRVGAGAGPFRVETGRRTLDVRAEGFQSTTRLVDVRAGGIARETVTLMRAPPLDPATGLPPSGEATRSDERTGRHVEDSGRGQRLVGWAFIGTGAALLATGVGGLLVRNGIVEDYNRACPGLGVEQPAGCDDQITSSRTWTTVAVITLVGGGLFTAGGAALLLTAPSAELKKGATARRQPFGCSPTLAGVACAGAF